MVARRPGVQPAAQAGVGAEQVLADLNALDAAVAVLVERVDEVAGVAGAALPDAALLQVERRGPGPGVDVVAPAAGRGRVRHGDQNQRPAGGRGAEGGD